MTKLFYFCIICPIFKGTDYMKKGIDIASGNIINLTSVYELLKVPPIPGKNEDRFINYNIIKQVIYTDATSYNVIDKKSQDIDKFTLGNKVYKANSKVVDSIKLNNYSYAIIYTIAKEQTFVNKVGGIFDIIKNIEINLSNPRDRKTLKVVKKVINDNSFNNVKFTSVFDYTLSSLMNKDKRFKQDGNVYLLTRNI